MQTREWTVARRGSVIFRKPLALLFLFVVLLAAMNWLLVNQRVVLYLYYVPVVLGAWFLSRRDAVGVALLAALMVVAYAAYIPGRISPVSSGLLLWTELAVWGGILVVTAYAICTLRAQAIESMQKLERAYRGVLSILSRFMQTVDADTEAHGVRVAAWAVRLAKRMGLDPSTVEEARLAGMLHDLGKMDVSVELLRKTAELSDSEREVVRQHTSLGAKLLKPVGGMLSNIADAIEAHHEKYDGSGYMGLQGEQIPQISRIIGVADTFDALLSDRPYRKGVEVFEAIEKIVAYAGTQFDPKVVAALQKILDEDDTAVEAAVRHVAAMTS